MDRTVGLQAALLDSDVLREVSEHDVAGRAERGAVLDRNHRAAEQCGVWRLRYAASRHIDRDAASADGLAHRVELRFYVLVDVPGGVAARASPHPRPHLEDVFVVQRGS